MRVAFLGPPGAGKGTQARELARAWDVPHIATGDMLRAAAAAQTPLGREARRYMEQGALVPDELIIALIGERLAAPDAARGFILDGFPRTIAQAEALGHLLKDLNTALDRVIFFDVSKDELLRRLTGRRVCRTCQTPYHVGSAPPRQAEVCDRCGGPLDQRADDTEETVRRRLQVFAEQTAPLLDYYRNLGLLATVRGEGPVARVQQAVRAAAEPER